MPKALPDAVQNGVRAVFLLPVGATDLHPPAPRGWVGHLRIRNTTTKFEVILIQIALGIERFLNPRSPGLRLPCSEWGIRRSNVGIRHVLSSCYEGLKS